MGPPRKMRNSRPKSTPPEADARGILEIPSSSRMCEPSGLRALSSCATVIASSLRPSLHLNHRELVQLGLWLAGELLRFALDVGLL